MVSTTLSNTIGLNYALALGGGIELIGFALFLAERRTAKFRTSATS
jgi:hypothetical protein